MKRSSVQRGGHADGREMQVVGHGWIVVLPVAIVSWNSEVRARTSSV
jgi:hypothetical protein